MRASRCTCPPTTARRAPHRLHPRPLGDDGRRPPRRRGAVRDRGPRALPPPGTHTSHSGRLSDGLEGYARTLLLAALRRDETALERYADGLAAGVAGVWPSIEDRSQPLVEAASVALALRLTRPLLWDRLDDPVRQRAADWLADALTAEPWPCNWELFPVTVGGFLQDVGHEVDASRKAIDRGLSRIEDWYVGDGWYTDGDGRKFDYYNGWAMHLYPVLHAWLADDPRLLDLYGGRLERHLADYARLFGADGAPMLQGRSLTYRFATAAPLWLGALTGRTPLPAGETRRLASGALKYFLERDAVDADGLLTLGWHGPNEAFLQSYSGPASPVLGEQGLPRPAPPAGPRGLDGDGGTGPGGTGGRDHAGRARQLAASVDQFGRPRPPPQPRQRGRPLRPVLHAPRLLHGDGALVVVRQQRDRRRRSEPYGDRAAGGGEGWVASRHTAADGAHVVSLVVAEGAVEVRAHLVVGAARGRPCGSRGGGRGVGCGRTRLPARVVGGRRCDR